MLYEVITFYQPRLAISAQQIVAAWNGYAWSGNQAGNCPIHFRRMTPAGALIAAANELLTPAGSSTFNPVVALAGADLLDFLLVYNRYWEVTSLPVDRDGNPGAATAVSARYGDTP